MPNDAGGAPAIGFDRILSAGERTATRIVEWADVHGMGQLAGIAELRELTYISSFRLEDQNVLLHTVQQQPDSST